MSKEGGVDRIIIIGKGHRGWVKIPTGVYNYPGTRWYGATKNGMFMSEAAARGRRPPGGEQPMNEAPLPVLGLGDGNPPKAAPLDAPTRRLHRMATWGVGFSISGLLLIVAVVALALFQLGHTVSSAQSGQSVLGLLCLLCLVSSLFGIGLGICAWRVRRGKAALVVGLIPGMIMGIIFAAAINSSHR